MQRATLEKHQQQLTEQREKQQEQQAMEWQHRHDENGFQASTSVVNKERQQQPESHRVDPCPIRREGMDVVPKVSILATFQNCPYKEDIRRILLSRKRLNRNQQPSSSSSLSSSSGASSGMNLRSITSKDLLGEDTDSDNGAPSSSSGGQSTSSEVANANSGNNSNNSGSGNECTSFVSPLSLSPLSASSLVLTTLNAGDFENGNGSALSNINDNDDNDRKAVSVHTDEIDMLASSLSDRPPARKRRRIHGRHGSSKASSQDGSSSSSSTDGNKVSSDTNTTTTASKSSIKSGAAAASLPQPQVAAAAAAPPKKKEAQFRQFQCDLWSDRYAELVEFHANFHHCDVEPKDNKRLSHWVRRQRYQYKQKQEGKRSVLTDERQRKLQDLGFIWSSHDAAWERQFSDLIAYKAKHGHTNVPTQCNENPPLGIWVKAQRRKYRLFKKGEKSPLTIDRINRLNAIGFRWMVRPTPMKAIEETFGIMDASELANLYNGVGGGNTTLRGSIRSSNSAMNGQAAIMQQSQHHHQQLPRAPPHPPASSYSGSYCGDDEGGEGPRTLL